MLQNLKKEKYDHHLKTIFGVWHYFKKEIRFLQCAIDIFREYAWVVLLQDKNSIAIVNAFKSI